MTKIPSEIFWRDETTSSPFNAAQARDGKLPRLLHASNKLLRDIIPYRQKTIGGKVGVFTFAQDDETVAHAYALKDGSQTVFMVGRHTTPGGAQYTFITARDREAFFGSLHPHARGPGGFIYEVDPHPYHPEDGPDGSREWIADVPATIIGAPRRVTLEESMYKGVQVFILNTRSENNFSPGTDPLHSLLKQSDEGRVDWLNRIYGVNPLRPLARYTRGDKLER